MLNLYSLNQKYNWLRLQIGGGGGTVNNPLTADLDGGNYNITNVDQLQSTSLTTQDATISTSINNTEPPKYVNLGALTSGNDYELANINIPADAEGDIVIHLRALQTPIKQEVLLSVIAYTDRVDIVVLNHLSESDTLVFTNIKYGTDGVKNSLVFTCGTSTTDCEYTVYQNQTDKGTGTYGSFFVPSFVLTPITLTSTYNDFPLTINTVGGTSNIQTTANLIATDTQTGSIGTNDLRSLTAPNPINLQNDIDGLNNRLTNFNTTETFNIASPSGTITSTANIDLTNTQNINNGNIIETANLQAPAPITDINVNTQINMNNLDINSVQNIRTDNIREATLGNDIVVHDEINMNNNTIKNVPNPVNLLDAVNKQYADSLVGGGVTNPMTSDLNGGNYNITNTNTISATSIDGNTVTGNAGGTIESRGEFIHGFGTATNFSVGGSDITFAPSGTLKVKDFALTKDFIDYTNATSGGIATLNINDTATTLTGSNDSVTIDDFATLDIGNNGIFKLDNPPSFVSQPNQLGVAQLPDTVYGSGNMDVLSLYSSNFTNNDPLIVAPSFNFQVWIKDVTVSVPLNAGTQWNNTSDGNVAPLYDFDPISAIAGYTDGIDNVGTKLNINDAGYLVGVELHNRSLSGGWICSTSNASLELVYFSSGVGWTSFPAPLYLAGGTSSTIGFNQSIFTLGYLNFIKTFGGNGHSGIWLGIKFNIPVGEFIDIQDVSNAMVSGTKSQIYNLRIL